MTTRINNTIVGAGTLLLIAASLLAAYTGEDLLLLLLPTIVVIVFLLQYPRLLFYALLASIPWSAEYSFSASLGTDLPDEPLMLLTAFAAITLWLYKTKRFATWRLHPLLFLLLLGFGWTAITAASSTHPLYSVKYLAAKGWYLLAFVAAPLLLGGDKKLVKQSAVVLCLSMVAVVLVVLCKHALLGFKFADVNEALEPFFRNHVNYSALLVLLMPLQLAFLHSTKNQTLQRFLWVSLLVTAVALYFSYSRGAWLAFVVGLAGFWLIRRGWLAKILAVGLVTIAMGAAWLLHENKYLQFAPNHDNTIFHENFSEHLAATYKGQDVSTAERFHRWVAGTRMAREELLTGFGPATFYHNYKPYAVPLFRTWVSDNPEKSTVHNYFLLLLIEQGVAGLLLFLLLLGALFWYAQRLYRQTTDPFWKTAIAAVGAMLLMQCTLNFLSDLIETDKVGSVFYLCVAILVIADRNIKQLNKEEGISK